MTRQEFIDRTGFTPTEDHFKAIHEEYMADGEDLTMALDEIGAALAAGTGSKA